jgi:predicted amidohydrolase
VPAKTYDNTVFRVICNQVGDGDNEAGHTFEGLIFVCDPADKLMASSKDGIAEEIVISKLESSFLDSSLHVPETFFRHFRRPEIYNAWESKQ